MPPVRCPVPADRARSHGGASALLLFLLSVAGLVGAGGAPAPPDLRADWADSGASCSDFDRVRALPEDRWQPFVAPGPGPQSTRMGTVWVRLTPATPQVPAVRYSAYAGVGEVFSVVTRLPPDYRASVHSPVVPASLHGSGVGAIDLPLPSSLDPSAPLYYCLVAPQPDPGALAIAPSADIAERQLDRQRLLAVSFTAMAAMAVFALAFFVRLRERMYLTYAIYVVAFILYQAYQLTALSAMLPMASWGAVAALGTAASAATLTFAVLFGIDFCRLSTHTPRLVGPIRIAAMAAFVAVPLQIAWYLSGLSILTRAGVALLNIAALVAAPLTLYAATVAALRGERYARYFVVGWTPVVLAASTIAVTGLAGLAVNAEILLLALLAAAMFESTVLAFGLADRALRLRIERDEAMVVAMQDPLTGLLNRRAIEARLGALLADFAAGRARPAALFVDLDSFKRANDTLGHAVGDAVIRAAGSALRRELGGDDAVGRYGGDEFLVLLADTDPARLGAIAERLRHAIAGAVDMPRAARTTASIGAALALPGEDAPSLLARADQALYRAKDAGRNTTVVAHAG